MTDPGLNLVVPCNAQDGDSEVVFVYSLMQQAFPVKQPRGPFCSGYLVTNNYRPLIDLETSVIFTRIDDCDKMEIA